MKNECCIKTINQIEEWLKKRTITKVLKDGKISRIQFMPFEWVKLKSELIGEE